AGDGLPRPRDPRRGRPARLRPRPPRQRRDAEWGHERARRLRRRRHGARPVAGRLGHRRGPPGRGARGQGATSCARGGHPLGTRLPLVLLTHGGACSGSEKKVVVEKPPPRDLGPIEIGPPAPEQRHLDTETYSIDLEAPPVAAVNDKVVATVTLKTKGDL